MPLARDITFERFKHTSFRQQKKLAIVEYVFRGNRDVREVIDILVAEYGPPSSITGQYETGALDATWEIDQEMRIMLSRAIPGSRFSLGYIYIPALKQMQTEIFAMVKEAKQKANR
jgi:hypothetical protein